MANTEHSTTTRRAILGGIAATATATTLAVPAASASTTEVDVLAAWRAFHALETEWWRLEDEIAVITAGLPDWVTKPRVLAMTGKYSGDQFWASSVTEIDRYLLPQASIELTPQQIEARQARRDEKVVELVEIRQRADVEAERSGWAPRYRRQEEIDEMNIDHRHVIDEAIGSHPVIVAAKIYLTLASAPAADRLEDWPVCYLISAIRGMMSDLPAEMQEGMAPIAAGKGRNCDIYRRAELAARERGAA